MAGYKAHVRTDISAKGYFGFRKTNVKYAHDGIEGLRQVLKVPQTAWVGEQTSGTFTTAYTFDAATGRTPAVLTCSSPGVYKIRVRVELPPDFGGEFPADGLSILTRRNAAITHLKLTMLNGATADPSVNGVSVSPASASVWQAFIFTPTGTYAPRDWVTFVVEFSADTAADAVEVADLAAEYLSGRGYAR